MKVNEVDITYDWLTFLLRQMCKSEIWHVKEIDQA